MNKRKMEGVMRIGLGFGAMLVLCGILFPVQAEARTKPTTYSVVQVTAMDETVSFKVVDDDMIAFMKKELDKEYKDALKAWTDAQKAAKKAKEEYTEPKPVKPQVKVIAKKLSHDEAKAAMQRAKEGKVETGDTAGSNTKYSLFKITGHRGDVSFELVADKEATSRKKELEQAYKEALKIWEAEKADAKKSKTKFEKEKPRKPMVKILKKGLKKDKAEEALKKEEAAFQKKQGTGDEKTRSRRSR